MSEIIEEKRIALSTLRAICSDDKSPATARASAARTLLEVCGEIGRLQTERPNDNKGLHEMSRAELDAELKRLSSAVYGVSHGVSQSKIRQARRVQAKKSTKLKGKRAIQRPRLGRKPSVQPVQLVQPVQPRLDGANGAGDGVGDDPPSQIKFPF
jgi:hypothetical protein